MCFLCVFHWGLSSRAGLGRGKCERKKMAAIIKCLSLASMYEGALQNYQVQITMLLGNPDFVQIYSTFIMPHHPCRQIWLFCKPRFVWIRLALKKSSSRLSERWEAIVSFLRMGKLRSRKVITLTHSDSYLPSIEHFWQLPEKDDRAGLINSISQMRQLKPEALFLSEL